jgi:hypothetical protein
MGTWASADFFPGEGKNFPGGGARTYFLPKKQRKRYYFSEKSLKTILLMAGLGPADAHGWGDRKGRSLKAPTPYIFP